MKLLQIFLVLLSGAVFAANSQAEILVGAGALLHNMGKITNSNDSSTSLMGEVYVPTVSLGAKFSFISNLSLFPSLIFTPIAKKGKDQISKRLLILTIPVVFPLDSTFELKAGPGIAFYYVGGPGGTAVLNNGTSTATFYRPSKTKHSQTLNLDLGASAKLGSGFRLDLDILIDSAISSRRAFNLLFQISKGFL